MDGGIMSRPKVQQSVIEDIIVATMKITEGKFYYIFCSLMKLILYKYKGLCPLTNFDWCQKFTPFYLHI